MEGGAIFFIVLSILFLVVVFGMNIINMSYKDTEGFDTQGMPTYAISKQIRGVLDSMDAPELCPIYATIREFAVKNEMTANNVSEQEANLRFDRSLAIKIPGGGLPCPFLTYPADTAKDEDWLDFLTRVPPDFGARVIFMALHARKELGRRAENIKAALQGKPTLTEDDFAALDKQGSSVYDGFTGVFTPTLEKSNVFEEQTEGFADSPEDDSKLTPQERLQKQVTKLLENLKSTKAKVLKSKGVSEFVDIAAIISSAKESSNYIAQTQAKANDGSIAKDVKLPP